MTNETGVAVQTRATARRVQLSRKKGWRMPPNTVSVARPGKWGNPFKVGEYGDALACVEAFRRGVMGGDVPTSAANCVLPLVVTWRGGRSQRRWTISCGHKSCSRVSLIGMKSGGPFLCATRGYADPLSALERTLLLRPALDLRD
jgi:hypothetical protein